MNNQQPPLGIKTPMPMKAETVYVSVIADIPHGMIEDAFAKQVTLAIRAENPPAPITVIPSPILDHLHTPKGRHELREQLNQRADVVVALVGVESASSYEQDLHQLLATWSDSKKPVLLLASANPTAARKAVDSWQGWELLAKSMKQPVETLKKAVIVNDEYVVAQGGEKALAQIKKSVSVAEILKPLLTPAHPPSLSGTVEWPSMEGAAAALTTSIA